MAVVDQMLDDFLLGQRTLKPIKSGFNECIELIVFLSTRDQQVVEK